MEKEAQQRTATRSAAVFNGRYRSIRTLKVTSSFRAELVEDCALEGEKLVLKLIHRHLLESEEDITALRRAVLSARQLSHPNITRLFDLEQNIDGQYFYSSEFVDGSTLRSGLNAYGRRPLPADVAIETLRDIARGLQHAHGKGIAHLDLRPENILLGKNGDLKIADFGITRSLLRDHGTTRTGEMLGEMLYMAPEQLRGGQNSCATDVYSYGILAYELLTGQPPFPATSQLEVAEQHLRQTIPALRDRRPDLPSWLETLLFDCTGKKPSDRLPDGTAVLQQIERHANTGRTERNTFVVCFRNQIRRKTWISRMANVAVLYLVLGLGAVTLLQREERLGAAVTLLKAERSLGFELPLIKALLNINGSLIEPGALAEAILNHDRDSVVALIRAGANPHATYRNGERILDLLLFEGDHQTLYYFLSQNIRFDLRDAEGNTPFLYAMKHHRYRWLPLLSVAAPGADLPDFSGTTPLILAVKRNENYWIDYLLRAGMNPNAHDARGRTALHYAAEEHSPSLVRTLIAGGADTNVWDHEGRTPLHLAADSAELTRILLNWKANPRSRSNDGRTPLHVAAHAGNAGSVSLLLRAGAIASVRDDSGKLAVDYAAEAGTEQIRTLLSESAPVGATHQSPVGQ